MTDYLLIFPERADAEEVAQELSDEEFAQVRVVRDSLAGEIDSQDHDWAVQVVADTVDGESATDQVSRRVA